MNKKYSCPDCFDTGCMCGGIGVSCHGCCACKEGKKAQDNHKKALLEVALLIQIWRKENSDVN